jgi:hypothetical protein
MWWTRITTERHQFFDTAHPQENEQKFQPLPTDASTYDLESFQVLSRFTLRPP